MSTYTNRYDEKIILKDNDEITSIDLEKSRNLKVLIIDNLSKLEKIVIPVTEGIYISISNCKNLIDIMDTLRYLNDNQYGSYFYLGENLKSLIEIRLSNFKTLKVADEIFDNLESVDFDHIERLICDFKNFPKLDYLRLLKVNSSDLILNSEILDSISLRFCSIKNIEIIGKCLMQTFIFNSEYISLKVENPIKVNYLSLCYDDNKFFPYIPLSDKIDDDLIFCISNDTIYDSEYKFFIERNLSKIKLIDHNDDELSLDDIKFSIPQKKRAR